MSALPSGRRRSPIAATTTAASVPSEFAAIASDAGREEREVGLRLGDRGAR